MLSTIKVYNLFRKKYKTIKIYQEYNDTLMFFEINFEKKKQWAY